jgi:hypothetical protein
MVVLDSPTLDLETNWWKVVGIWPQICYLQGLEIGANIYMDWEIDRPSKLEDMVHDHYWPTIWAFQLIHFWLSSIWNIYSINQCKHEYFKSCFDFKLVG